METEAANTSSKYLEQASADGDAEYEAGHDDAYYEDDNKPCALQPVSNPMNSTRMTSTLSDAAVSTQAALPDTPTMPFDVLLTGQLVKEKAGKLSLKKQIEEYERIKP